MMKNKIIVQLFLAFIVLFTFSCSKGPEPINYGEDACDFCRMSIVDQQHAAQLVTEKGKNYKYDAIECMMNDYKDWTKVRPELFLVNDYLNPGKLIDAKKAQFLISVSIPSPMGEFLSAFGSKEELEEVPFEKGKTMNWLELQKHFEIK
ncbi:MAG: nitrous oxide reductase accessory protein NosL [Cytophagales bacterium]